jgi:hypothetical protein
MEKITQYVSPHTGQVYTVTAETQSRMGGNWYAGEPLREVTVTQYNFYRDGHRVTWTYDLGPAHLASTFGELEGVYAPWSTSARD